MKKDTAKSAGKITVIILGMAIVFFLLLPFLEPDAPNQTTRQSKKASPQIFTANPLSELVRKVYSIFSRKSKEKSNFVLASVASTQPPEGVAAANPPGSTDKENTAPLSSHAVVYDTYGNASIIDDFGEWVLIRQTAPEASQRGMHEVNSSDNPYEKYVRLQHAAKYTKRPEPAPVPDSAWARLWKPISSVFGHESKSAEREAEEKMVLAATGPTTGLGQQRANTIYGSNRRNKRPQPFNQDFSFDPSVANPVFTLLNPAQELQGTADGLIATAKAVLPPDAAEEVIQNINKDKERLILKTLQIMEEKFNQDAEQAEEEELVSKTISPGCKENSLSGFYRSSSGGADACYTPNPNTDDEVNQAQLVGREQLREALEKLIGYSYQAPKPIKMVVVLNKTSPGEDPTLALFPGLEDAADVDMDPNAPETPVTPEEATRVFYQYLYQAQGCDKQDCYWVGSEVQRGDPSLRQTVDSSGLQFAGDPLGILQKVAGQFMDEMMQSPNERDVELGQMLQNKARLPIYTPYTESNFEQVNEEHNKPVVAPDGSKKSPSDPILYYTGNAANAKKMKKIFPSTAIVFYDTKEKEALSQNNLTPIEKGKIITEGLVERVEEGTQALVEAKSELNQKTAQNIVHHLGPQLRQQAQQAIEQDISSLPTQSH